MLTCISVTRKMVRHAIIQNEIPPEDLPRNSIQTLNGFYNWIAAIYPDAVFITTHVDPDGVDHIDVAYFRTVEEKSEEETNANRKN